MISCLVSGEYSIFELQLYYLSVLTARIVGKFDMLLFLFHILEIQSTPRHKKAQSSSSSKRRKTDFGDDTRGSKGNQGY